MGSADPQKVPYRRAVLVPQVSDCRRVRWQEAKLCSLKAEFPPGSEYVSKTWGDTKWELC